MGKRLRYGRNPALDLEVDRLRRGRLAALRGTNDDGSHWLTLFDAGHLYPWAEATISFDANWSWTGVTGTNDDGSHTVTSADIAAAYDSLLWFSTPYDPNHDAAPVDQTLFGGQGTDILYGFGGDDTLDGGGGSDILSGGFGDDIFVFHAGEADGDTVLDFDAHGEADLLKLVGYGPGASLTQTDATHVEIDYDGGAAQEIIALANAAAIQAGDYLFV